MCLIITGKAETLRSTILDTPRLLEDIYRSNPDGIGVMYPSRRGLRIFKKLPKNADQARHFLTRLPGDERNLAIHFRWQTHGFINKENCHPYTVVEGECALMHNGVLRTGNDKDRSKSDTWHFIKDYLVNLVTMAPGIVHDTGFKAMLRDFIGMSNRFVVMTKDGAVSVINAKEGVEHNGLWFSNTYAWTPGLLIESYKNRTGYSSGYQGGSYQGGGSFRGPYGGRHGYHSGFVDADSGFGDPYDDYYSRRATAPGGTPSVSGTTGSNSSGGSAGGHTGGVTSATRFSHRQEDQQEEEAWRKVVQSSQQKGSNWTVREGAGPASNVIPLGHSGSNGGTAGQTGQAGEKAGKEGAATAPANQPSVGIASNESLGEALLNADVDTFTAWLEKYPTTTLHTLFLLFTPEATKWCKPTELDGYSRYLYDAMLLEDKALLIAECEKNDGSVAAVAEVICFYLNWSEASTKRDQAAIETRIDELREQEESQRRETKVGDTVVASTAPDDEGGSGRKEHQFPTSKPDEGPKASPAPADSSIEPSDDHHVDLPHEVRGAVSEAQLSQGGDRDDGFAYRELYLG